MSTVYLVFYFIETARQWLSCINSETWKYIVEIWSPSLKAQSRDMHLLSSLYIDGGRERKGNMLRNVVGIINRSSMEGRNCTAQEI
jgi:hypothetical protein